PVLNINVYHTIEMNSGVWDWEERISDKINELLYLTWLSKEFLSRTYSIYSFSSCIYIVIPSFGFHFTLSIDEDTFKDKDIGQLAFFCENIRLKSDIEEIIYISRKPFIRQLIKKTNKTCNFYYFRGTK